MSKLMLLFILTAVIVAVADVGRRRRGSQGSQRIDGGEFFLGGDAFFKLVADFAAAFAETAFQIRRVPQHLLHAGGGGGGRGRTKLLQILQFFLGYAF